MHLTRLIYASVALQDMPYHQVMSILQRAQVANEQRGITGLLCFGGGRFLQALEGDRNVVNRLYTRIVQDTRHDFCTILQYEPIATRRFADWSMKLIGLDDQPTAHRRALVLRHCGQAEFSPLEMNGEEASALLVALADEFRASP